MCTRHAKLLLLPSPGLRGPRPRWGQWSWASRPGRQPQRRWRPPPAHSGRRAEWRPRAHRAPAPGSSVTEVTAKGTSKRSATSPGHGRQRHRKPRLFRRVGWRRAPASAYAWTTSRLPTRPTRAFEPSFTARSSRRRMASAMTHRTYPASVPLEDLVASELCGMSGLRYSC